jgi:hypothetical protein
MNSSLSGNNRETIVKKMEIEMRLRRNTVVGFRVLRCGRFCDISASDFDFLFGQSRYKA